MYINVILVWLRILSSLFLKSPTQIKLLYRITFIDLNVTDGLRNVDFKILCCVAFSEHVPETLRTWVQGDLCEEVPFYPPALQHFQGHVGLVDSAGDFLHRCHCTFQRLLCQSQRRWRPSLTCHSQHHMEWHCSGDALHSWYVGDSVH